MELTTEDERRIYTIAHKKYSDPFENIDRREGYMEGYKDATIFERQPSNDGLNDRIKELELERTSLKNKVYKNKIEQLEAERTELRNKVIEEVIEKLRIEIRARLGRNEPGILLPIELDQLLNSLKK